MREMNWFPENQVSNHRTLRRLIEKTVKEIINDSQESKSEHIAKFTCEHLPDI